jgi:hypothetical protein
MKEKPVFILVIGMLVFVAGFVLSLVFNLFILWANLEGQSFWGYPEALAFDTSLTTEARLTQLSCPLILTPGEAGQIDVTVANPNDYQVTAWVSAHISMPGLTENMLRETESTRLEPGKRTTLSWVVNARNVINNRMILFRAFLRLTENHPPARTKHCGIIVMDIGGLSGRAITWISLLGGHLIQAAGIYLWWRGLQRKRKKSQLVINVMIALSVLSILMSIGSVFHGWIISMISLLLALLVVFTSVGYGIGRIDHPSA